MDDLDLLLKVKFALIDALESEDIHADVENIISMINDNLFPKSEELYKETGSDDD